MSEVGHSLAERAAASACLSGRSREGHHWLRWLGLRQLAVALVFMSVWAPVLFHYWIWSPTISAATVQRSRELPADAVLDELAMFRYSTPMHLDDRQTIAAAEKLLQGELDLPLLPVTRFQFPFAKGDLEKGNSSLQLQWASLIVPNILLQAYAKTGRDEFLLGARDVILAWARYERQAALPRAYLWNDNSLAVRALVLADFWRNCRHHPQCDADSAREILQFAGRTGRALAQPGWFTVRTNHGVMQNLGLLHLCAAFPALADAPAWRKEALQRLADEMSFYVNDEGIVLEHSAGYHAFGLQLLGYGFRYVAILGEPIPADWAAKYEKAKQFYSQLRHSDGSLPIFGDTSGGPENEPPKTAPVAGLPLGENASWPPYQSVSQYPVAGYSIWWDGGSAQTVATWSYFPNHGHKHADEMSVLVWAAGHDWLTNTGYWPYWMEGRAEAESWAASNAPHLVGESARTSRRTALVASGWSPALAAVTMERTGPDGYVARRQALRIDPAIWLVVDDSAGIPGTRTTTTWTAGHNLTMRSDTASGTYVLQDGQVAGSFAVAGSPGMSTRVLRGSLNPFAGWQVVDYRPHPAPAIVSEQPVNGWSAALLVLNREGGRPRLAGKPTMLAWSDTGHWALEAAIDGRPLRVWRDGARISVSGADSSPSVRTLAVTSPASDNGQRARLDAAFASAVRKYPVFRDYLPYRARVSFLLAFLWVAEELVLFLLLRWPRAYARCTVIVLLGAIGTAVALNRLYFC